MLIFSVSFLIAVGINSSGICGALLVANPLDGCKPLSNDLRATKIDGVNFALIIRGECAFEDKVQNAQNAGFSAAIVYDNQDKENLVYSEPFCPFKNILFIAFIIMFLSRFVLSCKWDMVNLYSEKSCIVFDVLFILFFFVVCSDG